MEKSSGFTLMELMLAVTLFSVAIIISVSALLGIIGVQRRSSALQRVENNVNFAVKSMMVDISVGDLFYCGTNVPDGPLDSTTPQSCWSSGGRLLVFRNVRDEKTVYRLDNGMIRRCVDDAGSGACDEPIVNANYLQLTSSQVSIDPAIASFYVDGAEGTADSDLEQPLVQLVLRASASVSGETEMMNIQTTISQLTPDF